MILCILPTDSTVDITREQRTTAIILLVSVGITVWDRCTHDSQSGPSLDICLSKHCNYPNRKRRLQTYRGRPLRHMVVEWPCA